MRIDENPVFLKEWRKPAYRKKVFAFSGINALLASLLLISFLALSRYFKDFWRFSSGISVGFGPVKPSLSGLGSFIFGAIASIINLQVSYITPALSAGAISKEREQGALDLLLLTPLKPSEIIWGKLFVSIYPILTAILVSLPFAVLCLAFGGLPVWYILLMYLTLFLYLFAHGMVGLSFSAICRRTALAMVLSYIFIIFVIPMLSYLVPLCVEALAFLIFYLIAKSRIRAPFK